MTSTMERGEVVGLSDEVIAKIRKRFADEWQEMLEDMAMHTACTCGQPKAAPQHDTTCPVDVFRRAARAIGMRGELA
jgi:hypothetical protein